MKVLITGASTAVAYQLKSKIGAQQVILGDYTDLPGVMLQSGQMVKLPAPTDPAYVHKILSLCMDRGITHVYTTHQSEFELLHQANQLFEEYGINILAGTDEIR